MNFLKLIKPVFFSVISLTSVYATANSDMGDMKNMHMQHTAPATNTVKATGIITAIDTTANKLTLNHQAIKELNWPAMTMGFKVTDAKLLNTLKIGQKVQFELNISNKASPVITTVKKI